MQTVQAVIDRIEDSIHAVLLVGEDEKERIVSVEALPDGVKEGEWLQLTIDDDQVTHIQQDREETERRESRIKNKMQQLQQKKGNRF
ncbi:DUF3006 domain-containing protein [Geomicrobium sp. JCM 19039]|uniref:DUF3006 domain-containing protein n=1 Tax=Geomicrobium sp. JCM 19039 TaxID=1460636 RepID=UPI00045F2A1C|nr:DUF3006 domain-containing protein [Geomicrobium sp. JCM 19039]GAK14422.1 hypothetical protein JCM19039_4339 [Geomicrobium sp. JCM 19039]